MRTVTQERDTFKASVEQLTGELTVANQKLTEATEKLTVASGQVKELTDQLLDSGKQSDAIKAELTEAKATIAKLQSEARTVAEKSAEIVAQTGGPASAVAGSTKASEPMTFEIAMEQYRALQKVSQDKANDFYSKYNDIFCPKRFQARQPVMK